MKCNNCGNVNAEGATFCTECGGRLVAAAAPAVQPAAPAQPVQPQPQGPPQQQYAPQQYPPAPPRYDQGPSQYGAQYQRPYRQPKVPTIKSVHLGDVLFLISAVLLLGVGLENFSNITGFVRAQYIILGLVAIVGGLLMMAMVVMPELLKPLEQNMDMLVLAFSLVFLLWGLVATFANNVGFYGGFLFAAGLFGLAGSGLRMGLIK